MDYLKLLAALAMTVLFFIALFGALVTVPKQASTRFSYKLLVRATQPLRAGGVQAFFYWAVPVFLLLAFSAWTGLALLAIHAVGAMVNKRLLPTLLPLPEVKS